MSITSTSLTRAAGVAAVAAGVIFIGVQVNHPASDTFTTETTQWVAREYAKVVMAGLALAGITGMYLRQHRSAGFIGLVGYLVLATGYLAMFSVEVIAAVVLPNLVDTEPGFVNDVVAAANGRTASGDIGGLQALFGLMGAGIIVGGVIFGISLLRSGVLNRWGAALLAASTGALAALAALPESFNRPLAVPVGLALITLGVSLFRNAGDNEHAAPAETAARDRALQPVVR
ncbi:hypothetical protein ASC64_13080 [Nocardioides sp. Root122]|uniref:hypothetical protein n=1 Tax=Nocardioides TaxID=1839 RepID=UPI0007035CDD|nr:MULTISPECIES: hypothetical protein [Nocardioides]KQV65825.1 hypothetical protein ASC64_13080 [Nocardioides sp. Root122]MCK9823253.1 hypothetical protein [Nocardioides cavernae]